MTYEEDTTFLTQKFGQEVASDASFRANWASLLSTYSLNTEELHSKWEAWDIANNANNPSNGSITFGSQTTDKKAVESANTSLQQLRESLHRNLKNLTPKSVPRHKQITPKSATSTLDNILGGIGLGSLTASARKRQFNNSNGNSPSSSLRNNGNKSPVKVPRTGSAMTSPTKANRSTLSTIPPSLKYEQESDPNVFGGEELFHSIDQPVSKQRFTEVLNSEVPEIDTSTSSLPKPSVRLNVNINNFEYRQMRTTLSASASYLNDNISNVRQIIQDAYGLPSNEFGDPTVASQSEIVAVGRIISESNNDGGRSEANKTQYITLGGPEEKVGQTIYMIFEPEVAKGRKVEMKINLDPTRKSKLVGEYADQDEDNESKIPPHFFPGQILAVRGKNASGSYFTISEILEIPLLPLAASTKSSILKRYSDVPNIANEDTEVSSTATTTPSGLKIVFASGPYTTDNNLRYEPLLRFVQAMNTSVRPSALVLLGPFVDVSHKSVVEGNFELRDIPLPPSSNAPRSASVSYASRIEKLKNAGPAHAKLLESASLDDVFRVCVVPKLLLLLDANPNLQIILVPHIRDAISRGVSFPQPAFINKSKFPSNSNKLAKSEKKVSFADSAPKLISKDSSFVSSEERRAQTLGLLGVKNIHCVPNPALFSLNEVVVSACSMDPIADLVKNTYTPGNTSNGTPAPSKFFIAMNDILRQRMVYPLVPGRVENIALNIGEGSNKLSEGEESILYRSSSLDISHFPLTHFPNALPDILVVPSKLRPLSQIVGNVVVVNPGTVSKPKTTGEYSVASVRKFEAKEDVSNEDDYVNHEVYKRARVEIIKL